MLYNALKVILLIAVTIAILVGSYNFGLREQKIGRAHTASCSDLFGCPETVIEPIDLPPPRLVALTLVAALLLWRLRLESTQPTIKEILRASHYPRITTPGYFVKSARRKPRHYPSAPLPETMPQRLAGNG